MIRSISAAQAQARKIRREEAVLALHASHMPLHLAAQDGLELRRSWDGSITIMTGLHRIAHKSGGRWPADLWPELARPAPDSSWLREYDTRNLMDAIANAEYSGFHDRTRPQPAAILAELARIAAGGAA